MISINFNKELDDEGLEHLLSFFNQFDYPNDKDEPEEFEIYLSNLEGGDYTCLQAFKREFEKRNVKLLLNGVNYGAALSLFCITDCEKQIINMSSAIYTRPVMMGRFSPIKGHPVHPATEEAILFKVVESFARYVEKTYLGLTEIEKNKLDEGHPLYFDDRKLTDIFEKNFDNPK